MPWKQPKNIVRQGFRVGDDHGYFIIKGGHWEKSKRNGEWKWTDYAIVRNTQLLRHDRDVPAANHLSARFAVDGVIHFDETTQLVIGGICRRHGFSESEFVEALVLAFTNLEANNPHPQPTTKKGKKSGTG